MKTQMRPLIRFAFTVAVAVGAIMVPSAASAQPPTPPVRSPDGACEVKPAPGITQSMADHINTLEQLYRQAGDKAQLSWLLLPALHFRESNFTQRNPDNGQGIFQLYSLVKAQNLHFPPGQVTDTDFVNQAVMALKELDHKSRDYRTDGLSNPDFLTAAWAYFGYNGRAQAYYDQADKLGFKFPFEGSPYVYANFDPAHTGVLYAIKTDGGRLSGDRPENRVGAFTIYYQLVKQCAPNTVPDSAFKTDPVGNVTDPFAGQRVLPSPGSEGGVPFPWYALLATATGVGLIVLTISRWGRKHPAPIRVAWAAGLVLVPVTIHLDDVTIYYLGESETPIFWLYSGVALVLSVVLTVGFLRGQSQRWCDHPHYWRQRSRSSDRTESLASAAVAMICDVVAYFMLSLLEGLSFFAGHIGAALIAVGMSAVAVLVYLAWQPANPGEAVEQWQICLVFTVIVLAASTERHRSVR